MSVSAPRCHARARFGRGFVAGVLGACCVAAFAGCGLDAIGPLGAACAVDDNCPEGYACVELLDEQGLPLRSLCAPVEDVEVPPRLPLVSADIVVTRPNQSASIAVRDRDILELAVKEQPAGGGSVVLDGGRLTYTAGAVPGTFGFVLEGRGFKGDLVTARFEAVVVDEAAITHTWRGGGGDVFQDSTQWLEGTVPGAVDTVFVPAGSPPPRLQASATVGVLLVETGGPALVTTDAFVLGVQSAAHLGAEPAAGATVDVAGLAGAPARVAGRFSRLTVSGEGSAGPVRVSRDLVIGGAGVLDVGGDQSEIDGDLTTNGGGRLRMRAPEGVVIVHGNASFGGGDETSELTAGLLRLDNGFEQRVSDTAVTTTFVGQGTHTTLFEGVAAQGVTFESAGPSRLGAVVVDNGVGIALLSEAVAVGDRLELKGVCTVDGASSSLSVGRGVLAPAGTALSLAQLSVSGPLQVDGAYDVEVTAFTGNGDAMPAALPYRDVVVVGPTEIDGATVIGGAFTVESELFLDGNTVSVARELLVQGQGRLVMTNPADLVQVAGDVTFAGRDTDLALRAGRLEVQGALTQSVGAALEEANLVGSGEHTVALTGTGAEQALFFASSDVLTGAPSRLLDVVIEPGAAAVAQTAVRIDRQLIVRGQLRVAEGLAVDTAALTLEGGTVEGAVTCNGVACPQ